MAKSGATTIEQYLRELPDDRRAAIKALRAVIRKNLPKGYEEAMNWGMITYQVPLRVYPDTYNEQPLLYAALASQKNHMAVYLTSVYAVPALRRKFQAGYRAAGKKPDMGGSCVRFKKLEDLPLEVIGEAVAAVPMQDFVATAQARAKKK